MKNEEYLKQLVELGLSPREAKVYLSLLTKRSLTATEIAKISGIPRQKIYEILGNIINKGMCVEKAGQVKRYRAVDPMSVFKGLIDQYKEKEKSALQLSNDLSHFFKENMQKIDPLEYIEILKDKRQIIRRLSGYEENAEKSILVFSKAPYTTSFNGKVDEEINTLKNKIEIRSIYEYKDFVNKDFVSEISSWIRAGEEARVVEELPMKMVIFDEQITTCALNDPVSLKPSITTMIVNHAGFAQAQKRVFESYWEKAISFEEYMMKNLNKK